MKTLVIIDMQDYYLREGSIVDSKDSLEISILKGNIISLIQKFMDNNYPIILVEYNGSGKTNRHI
jgi:isochorismate hydrolase